MKYLKRIQWLLMAFCLTVTPVLQSCDDDDDGYSIGDFTPPLWATVRLTGNAFYLDCDVWGTLWPVNVDLDWYKPVEGQRVITTFNPLWDDYEGYDHAVKLLGLQNVLTKEVETLTPDNAEAYGNDPVLIFKGDMSISGGYLNILFLQNVPASTKHRISLVRSEKSDEQVDEEGYIVLQLRYNDYDDLTGRRAYGAVSFNLASLDITEETKGIKVKLNSEKNGGVEVTFDRQEQGERSSMKGGFDLSMMKLK